MPCAFVALDDGMDSFARALPKARWEAHGFFLDGDVVVVALVVARRCSRSQHMQGHNYYTILCIQALH